MKKLIGIGILLFLFACAKSREYPPVKPLDQYQHTSFSLVDDQKMEAGKNYIYTPTLLLAWNHLKEANNAVLDNGNQLVKQIDLSENHLNSLDENEYEKRVLFNQGLVNVETEFSRSLPFSNAFTRNKTALHFAGDLNVESFGCTNWEYEAARQVKVVHFQNQREFAVQLVTENEKDEIFLFCPSKTRSTLRAYYDDLRQKVSQNKREIDSWRYSFLEEDVFAAPVVSFNINMNIEALQGVSLRSATDSIIIEGASQRIALMLDEQGAEVESDARVFARAVGEVPTKPIPKQLIFDRPFLLVMKKKMSENPYFLGWISNTELLQERVD